MWDWEKLCEEVVDAKFCVVELDENWRKTENRLKELNKMSANCRLEDEMSQHMYAVWRVAVCTVRTSCSLPQTLQSVRRKRRTQLKSTPAVDIRTSLSYKGHRGERQVAHQVEQMCDREGKQGHALITLCQWRSLILIHSHRKRENRKKGDVFMARGRTHVISETRKIVHLFLCLYLKSRCPDLSM